MSDKEDDELNNMQCDDNMNTEDFEFDELSDLEDEEEVEPVDNSLFKLINHTKDVFCLAVSNSKRWLASGSEDDTACIWDLDNLESIYIFFYYIFYNLFLIFRSGTLF